MMAFRLKQLFDSKMKAMMSDADELVEESLNKGEDEMRATGDISVQKSAAGVTATNKETDNPGTRKEDTMSKD